MRPRRRQPDRQRTRQGEVLQTRHQAVEETSKVIKNKTGAILGESMNV